MQNQMKQEHQLQPSTHKERPLLTIFQSTMYSKNRQYSTSRKNGYISFGLATNKRVTEKSLSYFPSFLAVNDCGYEQLRGSVFLREHFSKMTSYTPSETMIANNIEALIDGLAFKRKVSYIGKRQKINHIFEHAETTLCSKEEAQIQFVDVQDRQELAQLIKDPIVRKRVLIVPHRQWVEYHESDKIMFVFQSQFQQGFKCGVLFCRNQDLISQLTDILCFHPLSTLLAATAKATLDSPQNVSIEQEFMDKRRQIQPSKQFLLKMMELDSGYRPKDSNIFLTLGASTSIYNCAYSIFKSGQKVGIDNPFYFFLKHDFSKSGIIFSFRSVLEGTLMQRVSKSFEFGQKGYIVVNPHNPTGHIIPDKQIKEVCEWAVTHSDYHILFDQVYLNSIHQKTLTPTQSSIEYADNYQNIHMIRGFAKDYGLCGFKLGFTISCNQTIKHNFTKWQFLISPQPYLITAMNVMLQKSNFGQEVYHYNQKCLLSSTSMVTDLLRKEGITFIQPKGGMFLMIDLSQYLQDNNETEQSVWTTLFYDYRVNISRGSNFVTDKPGWYRLTYLINEQSIVEGIRRIGIFLRHQKPDFLL